jgi:acyl dehydratase
MDSLGFRVRARNIATESENKIHDDAVARRYGFAGGLVPGIVVYGYMTRPLVETLGEAWLSRGVTTARFFKPCYDGEEIVARAKRGRVSFPGESPGGRALAMETTPDPFLLVVEREGTVLAEGTSTVRESSPAPPDLRALPSRPLPGDRPPASEATLAPGTILGSLRVRLDERKASGFAAAIGDDLGLYRGDRATAHPGFLLGLANEVLVRNVTLGPWIHAASEVEHHSVARTGDALEVRARVLERFARKGHEFVVLDVIVVAEGERPVVRVRHTAIYRPRPVA